LHSNYIQERKREAVVMEHQRKVQEAIKVKARVPDEMEVKAIKTMGAMEEGDAVFGAGAEVNLDSQVWLILLLCTPWAPLLLRFACIYAVLYSLVLRFAF
jgi:hypothetical protein